MRTCEYSHRLAIEILRDQGPWFEFSQAVEGVHREDVIEAYARVAADRGKAPAGGQTALNALFRRLLRDERGWVAESRLFGAEPELRVWKVGYLKERVGVEISFDHAEAIAWQLTRLTMAGESPRVQPDSQIDVGIIVTADQSLRHWARMDSAVGAFDVVRAWLREMRPILRTPLLLIGLRADDWAPTDVFRGTRNSAGHPS